VGIEDGLLYHCFGDSTSDGYQKIQNFHKTPKGSFINNVQFLGVKRVWRCVTLPFCDRQREGVSVFAWRHFFIIIIIIIIFILNLLMDITWGIITCQWPSMIFTDANKFSHLKFQIVSQNFSSVSFYKNIHFKLNESIE